MRKYLTREDAVFATCKVLDKFGGCKMGPLCPDVGCCEVRDIIDTFPMIEIPENHGKLIDADALKVSLIFAEETAKWAVPALRAVLMVIDEMPSIIPAESSKEGK